MVVPHLFESVQVLVCWSFKQTLKSLHCQLGVQLVMGLLFISVDVVLPEVQDCVWLGAPLVTPQ